MDIFKVLADSGFIKTVILDGTEAGIAEKRLILAFAAYRPDQDPELSDEAVVHPYYQASQKAYRAAAAAAEYFRLSGLSVFLNNDIPLKPILNRLAFLTTGQNTLGYIPECGSRFHVQCFVTDAELPVTDRLDEPAKTNGIGEGISDICRTCRKCESACPTHAISDGKFDRQKCLRNWMLCGQEAPQEIYAHMGNRLVGCDDCQRVCPMNNAIKPVYQPELRISLKGLLTSEIDPAELIGENYAIRNRVLAQACIIAACLGRKDLLPEIERLKDHRSPNVRQCADHAYARLADS